MTECARDPFQATRFVKRPVLFAPVFVAYMVLLTAPSGATDVCGDTACPSEQWTVAGNPYVATCEVRVPSGCTLTIDAGVEVRFQAGTRLLVEGDLDVNGAAGNETIFTSDAGVPAAADWNGIYVQAGASGSIEYARIDYATNAVHVNDTSATLDQVEATYSTRGLYVTGAAVVDVSGLTARYNEDGLYAYGGDSTVTVTGSTLTDNNQYGVAVNGAFSAASPSVTLSASSIHSNLGAYDYYTYNYANPSANVLPARGNWWGTTDAAAISARIRDYRTATSCPVVDWCGWLDGPGGSVERDAECPDLVVCDETADWSVTARPYLLVSDLLICSTGTLNVGPGVEVRSVKTTPRMDFVNQGVLNVSGAPGGEVRFTSDQAAPATDDWSGLLLYPGSANAIEHAAIDWAAYAVYVNGTSATLDQVEATNSLRGLYVNGNSTVDVTGLTARYNDDGLRVYNGSSTVTVTGSTLTDNNQYGVFVDGNFSNTAPSVSVTGSSIHSNLGAYDYYTYNYRDPSESVLLARGNWWGTTDRATISSRIRDYRTATSCPVVDWCGWLDGAGGVVERDVECPDLVVCDETADWSVTTRPYLLVSDLLICATGTLNVGPGVEVRSVKTTPRMDFLSQGTLNVNGLSGNETRFTSDESAPAVGDWSGLYLYPGSAGSIEHAMVDHGDNGVYVNGASATLNQVESTHSTRGLYVYGDSTLDVSGLTARYNTDGLRVNRGNSTVTVTGSTLTDNDQYGVAVDGGFSATAPSLTVSGSSIHSNLGAYDYHTYNYQNSAQSVLLARGNWWGTTDGATISSRIRDYRTATSCPVVDWCGWLDGAGGAVERDVECPDLVVCGETADWNVTMRPYLLVSDLLICSTGTLTVGPGVEVRSVKTTPRMDFLNQGTLNVNGVPGGEVRFTSDEAAPAVNDWSGLLLYPGSANSIEHAAIDWAAYAVYVNDSSATLDRVEATHSIRGLYVYLDSTVAVTGLTSRYNDEGLRIYRSNSTVTVAGSTLTDNNQYGVYLDGYYSQTAPDLILTGSSIHSNLGDYDLFTYNYNSAATRHVWVLDNWWGTTSEELIATRIRDYTDHTASPHVHFTAYGALCEPALGGDLDGDGWGDFEDNCPSERNAIQTDGDGDGMGDDCDPEPGTLPGGACDGIDDVTDGYSDADSDGWGDPCDFQPTRDDCHPGAVEICDGRDNDGDGLFALDELEDADTDGNLACADCEEAEPTTNTCSCEDCDNLLDDDCDSQTDGDDTDCEGSPLCIIVIAGTGDPGLELESGVCDGASPAGPYDVITGNVAELQLSGGSVDLGTVQCVAGAVTWDRVTELARNVNPACNDPLVYFVARESGAADFGTGSGSEPRDVMSPDPPCP